MPSLPRPGLKIASSLALFAAHLLLFLQAPAAAVQLCGITTCLGASAAGQSLPPPPVQFPFRLNRRQRPRCGYPGFDLSCTSDGDTLLRIPGSGEFPVQTITYSPTQIITIADPDSCFPRRLLGNFSLAGSPFRALVPRRLTFLNCSDGHDWSSVSSQGIPAMPIQCLSEGNFTVISVLANSYDSDSSPCKVVATVTVPLPWPFWAYVEDVISLTWDVPDCGKCRRRGGQCG